MHRCQPSHIRRDSPAFSSDIPRNETDVPHFLKMVLLFFSLPIILHFCLGMEQRDKLPIKIGSKFARRQTPDLYIIDQCDGRRLYFTRGSRHQRLFILFNVATPDGSINTATIIIHGSPTKKIQRDFLTIIWWVRFRVRVWVMVRV